jgi:sugar lactone lactonase YvrE
MAKKQNVLRLFAAAAGIVMVYGCNNESDSGGGNSPAPGGSSVPVVSTFAGSGTVGNADGTSTEAQFNQPYGVAVDSAGNVYVADRGNHRIRKITPDGTVSTLATEFNQPFGVAVDSVGNVYVADTNNHRICKITITQDPEGDVVAISPLAGSGTAGHQDETGAKAQFNQPYGVAVDSANNVYVADCLNNRIRKITPEGVVTTLAGTGEGDYLDGDGAEAQFNQPYGVAVDSANNVYVADTYNHRIRKITITQNPGGGDDVVTVSTLAGGTQGYLDGNGATAQFYYPHSATVDSAGNVYVADTHNHRIRKITAGGVVTTLAGTGEEDYLDGNGAEAKFKYPYSVAVDSAGNVYVADFINHRIRKITQ